MARKREYCYSLKLHGTEYYVKYYADPGEYYVKVMGNHTGVLFPVAIAVFPNMGLASNYLCDLNKALSYMGIRGTATFASKAVMNEFELITKPKPERK